MGDKGVPREWSVNFGRKPDSDATVISQDQQETNNTPKAYPNVHEQPSNTPVITDSSGILDITPPPTVCRICYENLGPQDGESLISPCHCKGTIGHIHWSCLNQWLVFAKRTTCDVCGFEYNIRSSKPSIWGYLKSPDSVSDRLKLLTDFLQCLMLFSQVYSGVKYCLYEAIYVQTDPKDLTSRIALFAMALTLTLIYSMCIYLFLRNHLRCFRNWQRTHMEIELVQLLHYEENALINSPAEPLDLSINN